MILVEQKTELALDFAKDLIVLDRGKVVHCGPSAAPAQRSRHAGAAVGGGWRIARTLSRKYLNLFIRI
jgi:ABC-type branched-subunit amino acid transport system ATPase component